MGSNGKMLDLERDTVVADSNSTITTDFGMKVSNTDSWLRVATQDRTGPMLLEDPVGREKIHRFDHERIPERVVHARGSGAFGHFKLYESAADVTSAGVLNDTSRTTPVIVRFSTVQGSKGSADTVRDVRGFSVKMYTDEGNWDIVGNNIPIFFIQDAIKFPDFVHSVKPEPHNEVPQAQTAHNNFWDFQYLHTEATHMFMWAMSDRAVPRSFRMMQGFGVNTYTLINKEGKRSFVKFHWTPTLGVHSLVWDEALKIGGQDPDFHRKDLWEAIEKGVYPTWKFGIQVCPEERQDAFDFDILDATKVWPEELLPVRYIGELQLNRNPDEFFTQVEQVAFCTSHIVPGIGFSDDPLLQGRNFSYFDTQISRLGVNWEELPVNRPIGCPVMNHNRDGQMRHRITKGTVNYWPNRFDSIAPTPTAQGGYIDYASKVSGIKARLFSDKFKDHFSQAQLFYNSLAPHEKAHATSALSFELDHCDDPIVYSRLVERLCDIDLPLAQAVAQKVGAPTPQKQTTPNPGKTSAALSQTFFDATEPTIASRRVAIIIADGYDAISFAAIRAVLVAAGAFPFVIGSGRQTIKSADGGDSVQPDHHFEGARSTLFDALFIPGGANIAALRKQARVVHWVREAFGHLKTIGAVGEAVDLVRDACDVPDLNIATSSGSRDVVDSYGVVTSGTIGDTPKSFKDGVKIVRGAKDFAGAFLYNISQHRCWRREMDGLSSAVVY